MFPYQGHYHWLCTMLVLFFETLSTSCLAEISFSGLKRIQSIIQWVMSACLVRPTQRYFEDVIDKFATHKLPDCFLIGLTSHLHVTLGIECTPEHPNSAVIASNPLTKILALPLIKSNI